MFILILSSQVQFTPLKHTIEIRRVGRCEWSRRQSATIWNSRNSPPAVAVCALHLPCELNSRRLQTVADEIRKLNTLTAIVQFTLPDPTRPNRRVSKVAANLSSRRRHGHATAPLHTFNGLFSETTQLKIIVSFRKFFRRFSQEVLKISIIVTFPPDQFVSSVIFLGFSSDVLKKF